MNTCADASTFRRLRPRTRPGAFTLVELLVVISIIAMLIALLMPALSAARDAARSAHCLSRLRQFGVAVMNYRHDYGVYPTAQRRGVPGKDWLTQIGPYIDPGQDNHANSAGIWHRDNPISVNFFLCPNSGYHPGLADGGAALIRTAAAVDSWRVHNYRIQARFGRDRSMRDPDGSGREVYNSPPKTEIYGDKSRIVMVGSVRGSNHARWGWIGGSDPWRDLHFSHPGETRNLLFIDGHAKNVGTQQEFAEGLSNGRYIMRFDRFSVDASAVAQFD